jgi:hypothetical protein
MIAKCPDASRGTRTFLKSVRYIEKHEHRAEIERGGVGVSFGERVSYATNSEKVAWMHYRGVTSIDTAPVEMKATAALSRRCKDPVCHLILGYADADKPTRPQMIADAERLLTALDMADHQYVLSVHRDTDNLHAHVVANRIGPDGKANALWNERIIRERVCAEIAAERDWGIVVGRHNRDIAQRHLGLDHLPAAPPRRVFDRDFNRAHGSGVLPWEEAARPYVLEAVERASSWDDLRTRLDAHGVVLKAVERGVRFQGLAFAEGVAPNAPGCGASRIGDACKLAALEARFGPYHAAGIERPAPQTIAEVVTPEKPGLWEDRMRAAILEAVDGAHSWDELRAGLSEVGVVVKGVERGGRFAGLAFAQSIDAGVPGCGSLAHRRSVQEDRLGGTFRAVPRHAVASCACAAGARHTGA